VNVTKLAGIHSIIKIHSINYKVMSWWNINIRAVRGNSKSGTDTPIRFCEWIPAGNMVTVQRSPPYLFCLITCNLFTCHKNFEILLLVENSWKFSARIFNDSLGLRISKFDSTEKKISKLWWEKLKTDISQIRKPH